ncbi:hypothetical protein HNR65_000748 [Desulfosalsimonas propionicica]|uniref:Uncharacterized protein n=1 Tax=Desulfosalsimonas propionicica TaxID=332175 RepID=A0A7W0HJQ3_9BACT|nr:hypothetical protein [Desulfosalsimonas propionicica]
MPGRKWLHWYKFRIKHEEHEGHEEKTGKMTGLVFFMMINSECNQLRKPI